MNAEKILLQFAALKDLPVRFDSLLLMNTFSESLDPVKQVCYEWSSHVNYHLISSQFFSWLLWQDVTIIYEAVREVNESSAFKKVLSLVLELGNILNTGNQRLSMAMGFNISYLKDVSSIAVAF